MQESYEVGSEENKRNYNIWLPEQVLPGFRETTTEMYWELHKISMNILEAMMLGLGYTEKERKHVHSLHSGHNDQLRLLHYPPLADDSIDTELIGRMPAHTDWR